MSSIDSLKEALTCGICYDIATLPVHPVCCENAKSMSPGCLTCVRGYYELNKPINNRSKYSKKSYNGCGCNIDIRKNYSANYYSHTTQLDMVRNLLGPSICPNEGCNVSCATTAELRRHLNGSVTVGDKYGACMKAFTRCNHCNFYGKRELVEGEHYKQKHVYIECNICYAKIQYNKIVDHYYEHKASLTILKNKLELLGLK